MYSEKTLFEVSRSHSSPLKMICVGVCTQIHPNCLFVGNWWKHSAQKHQSDTGFEKHIKKTNLPSQRGGFVV